MDIGQLEFLPRGYSLSKYFLPCRFVAHHQETQRLHAISCNTNPQSSQKYVDSIVHDSALFSIQTERIIQTAEILGGVFIGKIGATPGV